jgi:Carbohydrate binding domain
MARDAIVFVALFFTAAGVHAANVVQNPGFDGGTAGWTHLTGPDVVATYSAEDAAGKPGSGSVQVTNSDPSQAEQQGYSQCVPVVAATKYLVGATAKIPASQGVMGNAGFSAYWMSGADCTGYLGGLSVETDVTGVWWPASDTFTAHAGSHAARVNIKVLKSEIGGSLTASIDNIVFEPVLFADDFDSQDTSAWSASVP